jgi:hypothetical protein
MEDLKIYNYKVLLAKCLLAGILFFSFIVIAGFDSNSNSFFRQKLQTELVYSKFSKVAHPTVSYKKFSLPADKIIHSPFSDKQGTIALLAHSRLSKVKFDSNSMKLDSVSIPERFIQLKIIPQNSNEDSFSSSIA